MPAETIFSTEQEPGQQSLFIDLGPILDGDLEPERPALGAIEGSGHLFYAGRLNEIHAEPGAGKSNVVLAVCVQVLASGGSILFVDPEDMPQSIVRRLLTFGADRHAIRERFHYLHNPEPKDLAAAIGWAKQNTPTLVCVDGLAELMAGAGASERDETEVLQFFRQNLRPFAETGATVVVSDHVIKDSESRGLWSRGSGAKMGRYDGAVYFMKVIVPYSPSKEGSVNLIVGKDRNGGVGPKGAIAAEVHFSPNESGTSVQIKKPDEGQFRPTVLMAKISDHLALHPDAGKRDLRKLGRSQFVDKAIDELEFAGNLKIRRQGPGKPIIYELVEPFEGETNT